MAKDERKNLMGYVTSKWLFAQTTLVNPKKPFTGSNHWYNLITSVLGLSERSKARLIGADWVYPSDAVRKVLAVPPYELQEILDKRR